MTHKVLIVEDHVQTADMLRLCLEREGFAVVLADDGPAGEAAFHRELPHLLILDLMLPGFDGFELCRRIRQTSTLPVLMLTARTEDTDKAIGLGLGADDYLVKPFSPVELVARVKALLRRAYQFSEPQSSSHLLGGGRLKLDTRRRLVAVDGLPIELTPTEFKVLEILMANPGWAFTREHLLDKVWGYADEAGEGTVTAHMSNLRTKLGAAAGCIRTVRGVGYAYEEER